MNIITAYKNWQSFIGEAEEAHRVYCSEIPGHTIESAIQLRYAQGCAKKAWLHYDILIALLDHEAYGDPILEYANVEYPGDDIVNLL